MQNDQFVESYSIICSVGDGTQGQAFLARKGNHNFVVKLYFNSQKFHQYYSQQVQILSKITSPYIVRMVDHYAEARTFIAVRQETRAAIVLEFAEHGQLFKIVNMGKLSQDVSRTLFFQLITAIKHLKDINITHRDIKLENILLDERFNLKLADFGFARDSLGNNYDFFLRSWKGTESYMAPQIHTSHYKGEKIDLFASGVVLFLMFVRIPPFQNTEVSNQKYNLIREGRIQQFWTMFERRSQPLPISFKNLIMKLFAPNPQMRPTVQEVLNDEWVKGTILTTEELAAYMQPKYERLIHKDEDTRNIRRNLRQNLERMMDQHERINVERQRSRDRGENRLQRSNCVENSQDLVVDIMSFKIGQNNLPKKRQYNLKYVKITPIMALLWLNQYLSNLKTVKKNFFKESVEDIIFEDFQLKYDQNGSIDLTIQLDITFENDSTTSELKLHGQMLRSQDEISIMWNGTTGNAFWIYEIIESLKQEFELTFS